MERTTPERRTLRRGQPRVPTGLARLAARWEMPPARLAALILGFVVALGTLVVFAILAEDVVTHEAILLDAQANLALHMYATPTWDAVMTAISFLGTWPVLFPAVLIVVVALGIMRRRREGVFLVVVAIGGAILNAILKLIFQRPRPDLPWAASLSTYSFPSGHAMESLVCYLGIAVVVWHVWGRRWGIVAVALASVLVLAIGISRIYLGVHYFSDVIGGYAAGICWVSGAATATAGWRSFPRRGRNRAAALRRADFR